MGVICFVIHKQYTSNTHSQYTNIEAVTVKSDRLFISFYLFNLLTQVFNSSVSINTLGNISNLMTDNEFQAVFVHSCQLCSCYKGMTGFVRVVIHTQILHNLLETLNVFVVSHVVACRTVLCGEKRTVTLIVSGFYQRQYL